MENGARVLWRGPSSRRLVLGQPPATVKPGSGYRSVFPCAAQRALESVCCLLYTKQWDLHINTAVDNARHALNTPEFPILRLM